MLDPQNPLQTSFSILHLPGEQDVTIPSANLDQSGGRIHKISN